MGMLCVLGGFFVIADGAAFGGVTMFLGRLIAELGRFRVMLRVGFGRRFRLGRRHGKSPVFGIGLPLKE